MKLFFSSNYSLSLAVRRPVGKFQVAIALHIALHLGLYLQTTVGLSDLADLP